MNAIARIPTDDVNPRAVIGGNMPPEPTPYERVRDKIDKLHEEAKLYLDGEPVNSDGMADDIANLLNMLRAVENEAEDERKKEAKPHDDAKAEIQARYNALIGNTKTVKGKTVLASEACKKALAPWLEKKAAEQRAEAQRKAEEAAEAQRKAEEALRSRDAANLEEAEAAEALVTNAKKAAAAAKKAGDATAKAGNSTFGRAISTRTFHRAEVTDTKAFASHVWLNHRAELTEFLNGLAQRLVANGTRELPGVTITAETKVV